MLAVHDSQPSGRLRQQTDLSVFRQVAQDKYGRRVPLQLLVLRHGHAEQDPPAGGRDFDRTLRAKGRRMLAALAPKVRALDPDLVLSSPSRRTRETVEQLQISARVDYLEPLYEADADELLEAVREASGDDEPYETVLLVGHNPGVHQLVLELTGGQQIPGFPPSALAVITLDVDEWWQASTGSGRLTALHLPDDGQD
jgi:phosphohistidine phosphatase